MICSPELLHTESTEREKINEVLVGNCYPSELIRRVIQSHDDNRKKPKMFAPEKFSAVFNLPHLGSIPIYLRRKCKN